MEIGEKETRCLHLGGLSGRFFLGRISCRMSVLFAKLMAAKTNSTKRGRVPIERVAVCPFRAALSLRTGRRKLGGERIRTPEKTIP
jgi:hypothetical protein